jgi:hypothetical protein
VIKPAEPVRVVAEPSRPSVVVQPKPQPVAAQTVVAAAPIAPAPVLVARPIEAPQPTAKVTKGDNTRTALARDIQRELTRVGCYKGAVDGAWSAETRSAMRAFIDRVNASLPIDEPDHILKTLVQGHPGSACGLSCPTGQNLTADGRCLPATILAQGPKRSTRDANVAASATPQRSSDAIVTGSAPARPEPPARTEAVAVAPPPVPLPGRMSAGGPVASAQPPVVGAPPMPLTLAPRQPAAAGQPRTTTAALPPASPDPEASAAPQARPARERVPVRRAAAAPANPRPAPARPVARAPRYYAAYQAPRYYYYTPPRPRFGPSIFRQMERDSR